MIEVPKSYTKSEIEFDWELSDKLNWDTATPAETLARANRIADICVNIVGIVERARIFATLAHNGQFRKYERIPYIVHPCRVAYRVSLLLGASPELIAAAYLHDVCEDCGVTFDIIRRVFGEVVCSYVDDLTNRFKDAKDNKGKLLPRAERKRLEFVRVCTVQKESKWVKMVDRIDNLADMKSGNPDDQFTIKYAKEGAQLVESVGDADEALKVELTAVIDSILGRDNAKQQHSGTR